MNVSPTRRVLWTLALGAAAYTLLGLAGRATTIPGEMMALFWPAAGASIVVVGLLPLRWWPVAALTVVLATFAFNAGTGVPLDRSALFAVPNLAQALSGALVLRLLAPHLVVGGGRLSLTSFRDYVALIVAATVSSLAAVLTGAVVLLTALGSNALADNLVWWGRNSVGALVVLTLAVLLLGEDDGRERELPVERPDDLRQRVPELIALALVTVVLYVVVFTQLGDLPVAFPLLVPTVWAGLRFGPGLVAVHCSLVSLYTVIETQRGRGPFFSVEDGYAQALLSQMFVGLVFVVGSLLALASSERRSLARTLGRAHADASNHAVLLETVINSMREGVVVLDENSTVMLQNPAAEKLLRRQSHVNTLLDGVLDVVDPTGQPLPVERWPFARALRGEEVVGQELRIRFGPEGADRHLAANARRLPFASTDGLPQAVVIFHDVTAEKAHRDALEAFARTVAHDLKGPLGVVEGWSELLASEAAEQPTLSGQEVAATTSRIRAATATMRQLIRDLLESSVARDQQLRMTRCDLRSLAEQVAEEHRSVVGGFTPLIEVGDLPPALADEPLVRQLLHNLIGNAVKYVVPGRGAEISLRGRRVGDVVEVIVSDRGIGIPDGRHEEIFGIYSRAQHQVGYEGQGIGLSVCKTIVTRHGGAIHARPRVDGPGTAFVFTLPSP